MLNAKQNLTVKSSDDNVVQLNDLHLARTAQGDRAIAEKVLLRLRPKIFQVIRSAVRSDQEANEIGQVVLLEVLKTLGNFRGEGTLEAWAGGIAYRVSMRSLKNLRKWDKMHVSIIDHDVVEPKNPETHLSRQQLYDSLNGEMAQIPQKRRVPILLHLIYGYSIAEVAEIMGVSPNTIKDRLQTALRELRAIFDRNPALRATMLEVIR